MSAACPASSSTSQGGTLVCSDAGKGLVTVDMGGPKLDWNEIPLAQQVDTSQFPVPLDGAQHSRQPRSRWAIPIACCSWTMPKTRR